MVVLCYAPTEQEDEANKIEFYELEEVINKGSKKYDMILVIGDMNAKIGTRNEGYEEIMGKHGCGEKNDNGILLCDMCQRNNLVIG